MTRVLAIVLALVPLVGRANPPSPPFQAWLKVGSTFVHQRPSASSPVVGLLERGDVVNVTSCLPSCDARHAWALLGADGAVRLSVLSRSPESEDDLALAANARYVYGTVRRAGVPIYKTPEGDAIREVLKADRSLAFRPHSSRAGAGWLECAQGGFVRASDVRMARPSSFAGVHEGALPLAFVVRNTWLWPANGFAGPPERVARYTRWTVLEIDGDVVKTSVGSVSRRDVRIVMPISQPAGVPQGKKWVHVDLTEQTLTAYEGDRPVFATLVSTGKQGHETPRGLFRVGLKTLHDRMSGPPDEPYEVDEVPFTMYFHRGYALHGAFWHDAFGSVVSHGCVNLSMTDAEWLFQWAPPRVPDGWHAAIAGGNDLETLYVLVDRPRPARHWSPSPGLVSDGRVSTGISRAEYSNGTSSYAAQATEERH